MKITDTVGSIVTNRPSLSHLFEQAGIDYCCGGKIPLDEACRKRGMDPQQFLAKFEAAAAVAGGSGVNAGQMPLTALADHIEATHHAYLRTELPRLEAMTKKVATVHGEHDGRLPKVHEVFLGLVWAMTNHMMKEERILFPMVRQLEVSTTAPAFHCGSVGNGTGCNSKMTPKQIKEHCRLDEESQELLKMAMTELDLSARAYDRIL